MPTEEEERDPVSAVAWRDVLPCAANVWDQRIGSYYPCAEMADPESDLDLCPTHHARLTSILSLISAAQSTAHARETEDAASQPRQVPSRPRAAGSSRVADRDERAART
jgi:hypothetical protein